MRRIGRDKISHFVAGVLVGFTGSWLALVLQHKQIFLYGIALTVLVGGGKELIYDKWMKKGTPELGDFVATLLGGLLSASFVSITAKILM